MTLPDPPVTVLDGIVNYLLDYSELEEGAPIWVNLFGPEPVQYSVVPLPGPRILEEDLVGNTVREYPFAFQSLEDVGDALSRFQTMNFFEVFADWLEEQDQNETYPDLGSNRTVTKIEATSWAFLMEQGESQTGVYQLMCKVTYEQRKGN